MAESKSGGGSSATAEREKAQSKTDQALKDERSGGQSTKEEKKFGVERDKGGNAKPLPYPEHEPLDSVTYRDPRPLDWPQKADRRVFIGQVHQASPSDDPNDRPEGDYIYAEGIDDKDELEISGEKVEDAQVFAGAGQLVMIINGTAYNLGGLGGGVAADLRSGLLLNSNS